MQIHAFLGCDTTSRIYGFGEKVHCWKKFSLTNIWCKQHKPFYPRKVHLQKYRRLESRQWGFRTEPDESLNGLWYKRYNEKVLPPTEAATKFHSFCVFYQICQWMGCSNKMLLAAWGWKISESGLTPIQTDLLPAPEDLLKVIRCGCTTDSGSLRCSCRRSGLKCTVACSNCKGLACKCLKYLRWWRR